MVSDSSDLRLLAISVGNTRTTFAVFEGELLTSSGAVPNEDLPALAQAILAEAKKIESFETRAVVCASVNKPFSEKLIEALEKDLDAPVRRVETDLPIAIEHSLGADHTTGQDRLLAALGAYDGLKQACVVVDAGTAITVDFVDGTGVFHGGAIAPGAQMMLDALAARTAALPALEAAPPDGEGPYPKTTPDAMRVGVVAAARGFVRVMLDRYAESYGAYPAVIATGGDAETLFAGDELIESIVPNLVLRGVNVSVRRALATDDDPDDPVRNA